MCVLQNFVSNSTSFTAIPF